MSKIPFQKSIILFHKSTVPFHANSVGAQQEVLFKYNSLTHCCKQYVIGRVGNLNSHTLHNFSQLMRITNIWVTSSSWRKQFSWWLINIYGEHESANHTECTKWQSETSTIEERTEPSKWHLQLAQDTCMYHHIQPLDSRTNAFIRIKTINEIQQFKGHRRVQSL